MNLLSSTSIFSFFTIISRILGYLRDILIAIFLGASIFADAFFVAFRLPNTFRRLFAEGTFNAAFIPSYTSVNFSSKKKGKIFADDVRCSHGCTIGQLDETALFYLQTRGIPKKEARALLTYAFANNVLASVNIPAVKTRINSLIAKKLGVNLGFNL